MSLRSLSPAPAVRKGDHLIFRPTQWSHHHHYNLCAFVCIDFVIRVCACMYPTQVFVCLWKGCKVYNTPSTSQSWLQRHMLTHSGDKPFKVNTHARTHNSPVSHESEYLLTTWTTCNFSQPEIALHHVSWLRMVCVPAVCGGGLQRHVCLSGRAGPSRPHSLQLTEFIQSVQSGQSQGGVSIQGRPQQEEETEEQTKTLATYVQTRTYLSVRTASRCSI